MSKHYVCDAHRLLNCAECAPKTRAGDQPLPARRDDLPAIQDLVIADMEARKAVGLKRYGQLLKPFDGRDNLRDAYEEAMDLAIYLRKEIFQRDGK